MKEGDGPPSVSETSQDTADENNNTKIVDTDKEVSSAVQSTILEALATVIPTTPKNDHLVRSPTKPSGSPEAKKTRTILTPEGKRYQILFEQLKVKYRQQEQAYNGSVETLNDIRNKLTESEGKRKALDKQLTKFAIENEALRQKLEASNTKSTEETTSESPMDDTMPPLSQIPVTTPLCNAGKCIDDDDKYKFECNKCKKLFHYRCTSLPTYQITHFLTTNYRRYICVNCTKIPDYVAKVMKECAPPPIRGENSPEKTDVSNDTLTSLKTFLSEQVTKIENNLKGMIEVKLGENKKEMTILNENLSKVKPPSHSSATESPSDENETTLWSTVAGKKQDMKSIMRDARNDEKIEESEKERRSKNIIIHGAEEVGNSPDDIKKEDSQYVKELFKKISATSEPSLITRLGEPKESKSRPIKLVMKTKADKEKVMKNLGRLKGTERFFGKISVKDDYTTQEREEIRLLTEKAKQQSTDNSDRIFRVRGNSKNGWKVVSFPKDK